MTKYTVQKLINFVKPNAFLITRKEGKMIYFSAESPADYEAWIAAITTAKATNCKAIAAAASSSSSTSSSSSPTSKYEYEYEYLQVSDARTRYHATSTEITRVEFCRQAAEDEEMIRSTASQAKFLSSITPKSIVDYEYKGCLSSLVHCKGYHWKKQFCVLKQARLYLFGDMYAQQASGNDAITKHAYCAYNTKIADAVAGIIYLHGYKVQSTSSASRRHAFELIPPDSRFKQFLFYTESSVEKRR